MTVESVCTKNITVRGLGISIMSNLCKLEVAGKLIIRDYKHDIGTGIYPPPVITPTASTIMIVCLQFKCSVPAG